MKRFARLENSIIVEIFEAVDLADLATKFHADIVAGLVEILPNAALGMVLQSGGGFALSSIPLDQIRVSAIRQIDSARDQRLATGYSDAVTGKTYQCDPTARGNWTAMFLAAQLPGSGDIPIITADNSMITLAPADLQTLFAGRIMPWVQSVIHAGRAAKDAVLTASTEAEINTVLNGLSWPQSDWPA